MVRTRLAVTGLLALALTGFLALCLIARAFEPIAWKWAAYGGWSIVGGVVVGVGFCWALPLALAWWVGWHIWFVCLAKREQRVARRLYWFGMSDGMCRPDGQVTFKGWLGLVVMILAIPGVVIWIYGFHFRQSGHPSAAPATVFNTLALLDSCFIAATAAVGGAVALGSAARRAVVRRDRRAVVGVALGLAAAVAAGWFLVGVWPDHRDFQRACFLYHRASLAGAVRDVDAAARDYDELIRLRPADGHPWKERGGLYFAAGEYERAVADYRRWWAIDAPGPDKENPRPDDGGRYARDGYRFALALVETGRREEARDLIWAACYSGNEGGLPLGPNQFGPGDGLTHPNVWSDEALRGPFWVLYRAGAPAAALHFLRSAEDPKPHFPTHSFLGGGPAYPDPAYFWLRTWRGLAYQAVGDYPAAEADFGRDAEVRLLNVSPYHTHDPEWAEARLHRAWLLATCPDPWFRNPAMAVRLAAADPAFPPEPPPPPDDYLPGFPAEVRRRNMGWEWRLHRSKVAITRAAAHAAAGDLPAASKSLAEVDADEVRRQGFWRRRYDAISAAVAAGHAYVEPPVK